MARAMLSHAAMARQPLLRVPLAFAPLALLLVPGVASAQSITSAVANPARYLYEQGVCSSCKATDVTNSPRPQNQNPEGVSFSDCEQNLRLDFTLVLSGFTASDQASVQVWAGTQNVACDQDSNRSSGMGVPHPCWQVAQTYGPVLATTSTTIPLSVYARDVLRYEAPPSGSAVLQAYDPAFNASSDGEGACHVQTTDAQVPISLYFLAVDSTGNVVGVAYRDALMTDLVAPPPPCSVSVQGGGGVLDVAWSAPAADPDRAGFTLWTAPAGEAGCEAIAGNGFFVTGGSTELACHRQGISQPSLALLAGTVDDPTATSFTQTGLHADERYAVGVASIDGTGNIGPLSTASCAETGAAPAEPAKPTTATAGCGCKAAGASVTGSDASVLVAVGALALSLARGRRHDRTVL
jgi:hypothetical protein